MRSMVASGGLQGPASATATNIYAGKEKQMQTAAACRKESPTAKRLMHGPDNPDIHAVSRWQSGLRRTEAGIPSAPMSHGMTAMSEVSWLCQNSGAQCLAYASLHGGIDAACEHFCASLSELNLLRCQLAIIRPSLHVRLVVEVGGILYTARVVRIIPTAYWG